MACPWRNNKVCGSCRANGPSSKAFWDWSLAGLEQQRLPIQALAKFQRPVIDQEIRKHISMLRTKSTASRLSSVAYAAYGIVLGV